MSEKCHCEEWSLSGTTKQSLIAIAMYEIASVASLPRNDNNRLFRQPLTGRHGTKGVHIQKMRVVPHPTKAGLFRIVQRNVGTWDIAPWNWKWIRGIFGKN